MFIPIGDEGTKAAMFPAVSIIIIGLNILAYVVVNLEPRGGPVFTGLALVPARFIDNPAGLWYKLATTTFLHAGAWHLLLNLLFVWIFADNVEGALGWLYFALFYLAAGVFASAVHVAMNTSSVVPVVGASGAIAGILGMYAIFFPWNKVKILLFLLVYLRVFRIDSIYFLLLWFAVQVLFALFSPADSFVAYWAHTGGFIFGVFVAYLIILSSRRQRAGER